MTPAFNGTYNIFDTMTRRIAEEPCTVDGWFYPYGMAQSTTRSCADCLDPIQEPNPHYVNDGGSRDPDSMVNVWQGPRRPTRRITRRAYDAEIREGWEARNPGHTWEEPDRPTSADSLVAYQAQGLLLDAGRARKGWPGGLPMSVPELQDAYAAKTLTLEEFETAVALAIESGREERPAPAEAPEPAAVRSVPYGACFAFVVGGLICLGALVTLSLPVLGAGVALLSMGALSLLTA